MRRAERGFVPRRAQAAFQTGPTRKSSSAESSSTPFVPLPPLVLVAKDPRLFRSLLVVYHRCYLDSSISSISKINGINELR